MRRTFSPSILESLKKCELLVGGLMAYERDECDQTSRAFAKNRLLNQKQIV
jgi:hypothetical protein